MAAFVTAVRVARWLVTSHRDLMANPIAEGATFVGPEQRAYPPGEKGIVRGDVLQDNFERAHGPSV